MLKVAFITLGCKVNQYETQAMREIARNEGYDIAPDGKRADIYVINTCTVTGLSDKKSRQTIRKIIRRNPHAKVLVTGCYVDREREELERIEGVDVVFGNREKSRLAEYLQKLRECPETTLEGNPDATLSITAFDNQTRALVKVQDGCDSFCSYCIVPRVRGRIKSRPIDDIVQEVSLLAQNGYKEVVITGVHLGAYGKDIDMKFTLADVLERIHPIDGIKRIRLSSIEPMDIPGDVIWRMARLNKFAPHFHLPLQSGNDEILQRMNRKYTTEEYARLVEKIRGAFPDVGITTDIMVGFPSETEGQFDDTYNFVNAMEFSRLHVFRYSKRKGTPAANYPNQISPHISSKRSNIIRELGYQLANEFRLKMLNKEMEVLVEDSREGKSNLLAGFTGNYIRVLVDVPDDMINLMIRVKLVEVEGEFVKGLWSAKTQFLQSRERGEN